MARRQNLKIERTLKRTSSLNLVKQTFLIVCEGELTVSYIAIILSINHRLSLYQLS